MTVFDGLNLQFPSISAISLFMSNLDFMLSRVEHEKSFITLGPGAMAVTTNVFATMRKWVGTDVSRTCTSTYIEFSCFRVL